MSELILSKFCVFIYLHSFFISFICMYVSYMLLKVESWNKCCKLEQISIELQLSESDWAIIWENITDSYYLVIYFIILIVIHFYY